VDEDMIDRCKAYAEIMRQEKSIAAHLELTKSDAYKVFNEIPLEYKNYFENFSLKGILDRLVIDEFQNADIIDVKTTGKTISDFKDTVEFYNYWLQAAIYIMLVHKVYGIPLDKINYSFWVIDKYEQVYNFGVSNESKLKWLNRFDESFSQATYMIKNMLFDKPFEFQSSERIML
jgi:ATP-dependent exoDNAse (exonuclease V) beta subunit